MLHIPNVYHPLFILDFVFLVFNGENPSLFAIPGIPVVLKCPPDTVPLPSQVCLRTERELGMKATSNQLAIIAAKEVYRSRSGV